MAEYIERKAALAEMEELFHKTDPNGEEQTGFLKCHRIVRTLPAADVAPVVHGYWINIPPYRAANGNYNKAQECSVCNAFYVSNGNTPYSNHPYCAECGAKMDGGGHGN